MAESLLLFSAPSPLLLRGGSKKNELGGGNSGGLGVRPPEADDFSQLKGYLDATSGILGGVAPCLPP